MRAECNSVADDPFCNVQTQNLNTVHIIDHFADVFADLVLSFPPVGLLPIGPMKRPRGAGIHAPLDDRLLTLAKHTIRRRATPGIGAGVSASSRDDVPVAVASFSRSRSRIVDLALAIVLLAVIWIPRAHSLDRLVTPDEPLWLARSANFYQALADGNLDATYQFVHPGVTVMWAGTIGYLWEYRDYPSDAGEQVEWRGSSFSRLVQEHGHSPLDLLVTLRLVLTFISAIVLAVAFLCAVRLLGRWVAFAGFLLIALDPFHIGLTRLLHLDGLSTNLLFLSVISFLNHLEGRQRRDLVISGVAAGLAWLTRSANFVLGPFFGLLVLIELAQVWRNDGSRIATELRGWVHSLALWTAVGLGVFVALWPAMWTSPMRTLDLMVAGSIDLASEAHERQVYFAGEVIETDPGWHFYPLVSLWKTNPVILIGLLFAIIAVLLPKTFGLGLPRRTLFRIALFALTYALILTAGEKKLDRYILPAQTALDVIAGAGWIAAATWLLRGMGSGRAVAIRWRLASAALVALGISGSVATTAAADPYFLDYYNPLLGGPDGAREAMMVGWGEGMDLVADELLKLPGIEEMHVTAGPWPQSLEYFLPGPVQKPQYELDDRGIREWAWTELRVVTFPEVQRQLIHPDLLAFFRSLTPLATIELDGQEYAWIYDLRAASLPSYFIDSNLPIVDWGNNLRYVGTRISTKVYLPGDRVNVTLFFQTLEPTDARLRAEVRLLDPSGKPVDLDDDTADQPDGANSIWAEVQSLTVPKDAAPGNYNVILTVTDYSTGQPLPATRVDHNTYQPAELVIHTIEVGQPGDEPDSASPSEEEISYSPR